MHHQQSALEWVSGLTSHSTHNRSLRRRVSRLSTALLLTTKNEETRHYMHPKHKEKWKNALTNKTSYTLVWYDFYDLQPGNGAGPSLTAWAHTGRVPWNTQWLLTSISLSLHLMLSALTECISALYSYTKAIKSKHSLKCSLARELTMFIKVHNS